MNADASNEASRKRGVILVATTNAHKAQEIGDILAPLGYEVRRPEDLPDVVEDGLTFRDNACIKAIAAAAHFGVPALADDSGLVVDVLDGEPGVHSARYSGPDATAETNNALLVERLTALGAEDPAARFICHVVLASPEGEILAEAEGRVGFGYDPYFFHPASEARLSELSAEQKNAVSHRGRALRELAARLA